jgi:hypothetical protein
MNLNYRIPAVMSVVLLGCNLPLQLGPPKPESLVKHVNAVITVEDGAGGFKAQAKIYRPNYGGGELWNTVPDGTCSDGLHVVELQTSNQPGSVGPHVSVISGATTFRIARVGKTVWAPVSYSFESPDRFPGSAARVSWDGDATGGIVESFADDVLELPAEPTTSAIHGRVGQAIDLTWGGEAADMLLVELHPAAAPSAETPIITCAFADIGKATIPAATVTRLGTSSYDRVELKRIKYKQVGWVVGPEIDPCHGGRCSEETKPKVRPSYEVVGEGIRYTRVSLDLTP